ncbi:MAG: hypothetical protein H6748_04420 [Spirochaetaceae bacterium]|nr:hypothetical protein [Myxococcales bacterium]MCB9723276.1 hypothetical protein [Spirochaetaceae bacterium]HPG24403.1 hypothetical protein [Myxococcota bacterium]
MNEAFGAGPGVDRIPTIDAGHGRFAPAPDARVRLLFDVDRCARAGRGRSPGPMGRIV